MSRAALHVVSGPPGSGKSALIRRLVAARGDWLGLVNGEPGAHAGGALRRLPLGCPCCTGRIALQVVLTRALREARPARVLLELGDPAHAASLGKALGEWPLAQHLAAARALELPRDRVLEPEALERG